MKNSKKKSPFLTERKGDRNTELNITFYEKISFMIFSPYSAMLSKSIAER